MHRKPSQPSLKIRMVGGGVSPRSVSLGHLSDAFRGLSQIVDDGLGLTSLHLVGVRRGSALYRVEASARFEDVEARVRRFGAWLRDPIAWDERDGESMLKPLEELDAVARKNECSIELRGDGRSGVLATITPGRYDEVARTYVMTGSTSIIGRLERAGGSGTPFCVIRPPGEDTRQLHCSVISEDVVKKLSAYMFEDILFRGEGTWFRRSGEMRRFSVQAFEPPKTVDVGDAMESLRGIVGDAFNEIEDVDAWLRDVRGE